MGIWRKLGLAGVAAATATVATAAHAQQTPVDPGRIDERLRQRPEAPSVLPVEVPNLPQQQPAPQTDLRVTLVDVVFEGASAVPASDLEAMAAPYIGREMALAEVFRLAEEVTAEYRRRGFILSRAVVGPQRIETGVVTIQILEGYVAAVNVEGEAGGYRPFLDSYMAPVLAGRPTSGDALSRALLLARDLRGVDVRAVVAPSPTMPAAADISLVVERNPVEAFLALDNRGSRWLGPWQAYAGFTFNDALGWGERLSLTAVVAPEDGELGFLSLNYDQPVGASGLRVNAFASHAVTRPGDELAILGVEGESTTLGLGLTYPLVRSRATNLLVRTNFIARDSESRNDFIDPLFDDSIRSLSAEVFGNHADRWGGVTTWQVGVTQGLDILDATGDGDPDKSRFTGTARAKRLNIEFSRLQPLVSGLYLQLAAAAQISSDSLLASEEFGLGGAAYARAFDPSEVTGDEGVAGKVELFYTLAPQSFGSLEPYAFYEAGEVRQNAPLPGEDVSESLESAGFGVRVGFGDRYAAALEYAKPLNRDVAAEGDREARVFFTLSAAF
ncbi:MAG: ShlB/FhaC/HecB family hemolysin secretion/activation protein [Pseudomonadota bacterium]|nr:ShlB/FhaC/HecB family hemolysin secretion/activation protein [Pseudomonadota bacterium]